MEQIYRAGWQVVAQSLGCNHVLRAVLQTRKDHHRKTLPIYYDRACFKNNFRICKSCVIRHINCILSNSKTVSNSCLRILLARQTFFNEINNIRSFLK